MIYTIAVGNTKREILSTTVEGVTINLQLVWEPLLSAWLTEVYMNSEPVATSQVVRPYQYLVPGSPDVQMVVFSLGGLTTDLNEMAFSEGWILLALTGDDR